MKRTAANASLVDDAWSKRIRHSTQQPDRLSRLTDELTLRILSFLSPAQLCDCQRLSHRFRTLANDSSLWREHYFQRFVRPRSARLPGVRDRSTGRLRFSTPASKWLDEQHLARRANATDWKRQYKLKHNWSCGACSVEEITIDGDHHGSVVDMHQGVIFTADREKGLRAWTTKGTKRLMAAQTLDVRTGSRPTAICVDIRSRPSTPLRICVGFEDGSLRVFTYDLGGVFTSISRHDSEQSDALSTMSMAWPLLTTLSATHRLQVFDLSTNQPTIVHSVQASKPYWPTAVTLRDVTDELVVSIAYIEPTYLSGCTAGIQEIRFSKDGQLIGSRTATAITASYRSIALDVPRSPSLSIVTKRDPLPNWSEPISLSYSHPYLLVSRADRTLTSYLVTSTPASLAISNGRTLWGHSSSVSGAHVGKRGKAVSASKHGDELLIWELEGGSYPSTHKQTLREEKGILAKPSNHSPSHPLVPLSIHQHHLLLPSQAPTKLASGGWLGFDAENAVVLREDLHGRQTLAIYDFT